MIKVILSFTLSFINAVATKLIAIELQKFIYLMTKIQLCEFLLLFFIVSLIYLLYLLYIYILKDNIFWKKS